MHVVTSVMVALLAILVIGGCTGSEIAPAASAAPAPTPGNGGDDPLAALYATPADVAFVTVSDVAADLPLEAYAFLGYGLATDVVVPVEYHADSAALAPFGYLVDLSLAAADAVPPPVDLDAFFTAAPAATVASIAGADAERGPEMQQQPLDGWEAPPLDAK